MFILIYGNPGDGFNYRGPFNSMEEAVEYAELHDDYDETWWISSIESPVSSKMSLNNVEPRVEPDGIP